MTTLDQHALGTAEIDTKMKNTTTELGILTAQFQALMQQVTELEVVSNSLVSKI
ncbi:hypothetical protein [Kurthia huakuii]|uniref:hypothetical protein n=1 Tax=Kurthia huakuii TaxID=1421019 RepID=UPI0004B83C33|nr:hypothetical protein [Kurthia huakuii]MBM7699693.1 hypothetical protein [Kurthia huakuii]